ncbi:LacI family DNA-binding transcriptional regulator [Sphaerisporangium sp. B11E5]|uniref:LacI family DNA-binding transcriptional regulator n=1 Tax=Sphaerisporangium sp. B11E5 TaxID=3153563 RepID=UPI00325CBAEC
MSTGPTMATVAKVAGVSVPTVSRVLAGKPNISEETRERVREAARAIGYVVPKEFRRGRGRMVDLLITSTAPAWAGELVAGAERAAYSSGYTLALTVTSHPRFELAEWTQARRSRPSDGVLLVLSDARHDDEIAALAQVPGPLVLVDPVGTRESEVPTVGATNWSGGEAGARHLLDIGHRRVGFIGGPRAMRCTRERYEGYLAAHREFRVAPDPSHSRYGDFTVTAGAEHGGALLDLPAPPTAVLACSDIQAAGVYQAALKRGLRVPEDVSVVGFDDVPICAMLAPPLTTVRQPLAEMAAEAVRLIVQEQSRRGSASGRRVEIATSLVVRESTAPPAGGGTP